ncbi:MAG: FAD-binding protein, partial [Gemmatimonadetes bacterium]|nr:FAD-binding protein [Gemmatimonadota bacterium]
WLPLDPPATADATIGGLVALAASGPLRTGHGTPRDMALGVEIATGDGRLLRFGGRVVKNVAGYDAVRLAVGSRGRLGVITGLFLRVRGAPRADRTIAIACGPDSDGARRGAELALAVRDSASCDALELISPSVAATIGGLPSGWTLLVRMLGRDAAVSDGVDRVRRIVGNAAGAKTVGANAGGANAGGAKTVGANAGGPYAGGPYAGGAGRLAEIPNVVWTALARQEANATTALRLTGRPSDVAEGLAALSRGQDTGTSEMSGGPGPGWFIASHAAEGIIRLWRTDPGPATTDPSDMPGAWGELIRNGDWISSYDRGSRPVAAPYGETPGGSPVSGPVEGSAREQPAQLRRDLTDRLRNVFDPAGIMRGAGDFE